MTVFGTKLAEERAVADGRRVAGRRLLVGRVYGYEGEYGNDVVERFCVPPAVMVVEDVVLRWQGEWLDPVWDVRLVEPHPELEGIRSMWVYGHSYSIDGRAAPSGYLELVPTWRERIRRRLGL